MQDQSPSQYSWKSSPDEKDADQIGLIAEDFHSILKRGSDKEINGQEVIMVLWMAVQELSKETQELKKEIAYLKSSF